MSFLHGFVFAASPWDARFENIWSKIDFNMKILSILDPGYRCDIYKG